MRVAFFLLAENLDSENLDCGYLNLTNHQASPITTIRLTSKLTLSRFSPSPHQISGGPNKYNIIDKVDQLELKMQMEIMTTENVKKSKKTDFEF